MTRENEGLKSLGKKAEYARMAEEKMLRFE